MTMDRRTLMLGTAFASALPALPVLGSGISGALLPAPPGADDADPAAIVFSIDGWHPHADLGGDEQVWISVSPSWRATWR